MVDLTQFIISIVSICIIIATAYGYPMLRTGINAENWKMLQKIIYVAVNAAEQLGATQKIKNKLQYAIDEVEKQLLKFNIKFDRDTIINAIEAAVRQNFPKK